MYIPNTEYKNQDTNASFSDDELDISSLTANISSKQPYGNNTTNSNVEENEDSSDVSSEEQNKGDNKYLNNFSFNETGSIGSSVQSPVHSYIDDEAELKEKRLMLQKIRRYELRKGIKPERAVSIHSSFEEIKGELDAIRKECQLESSVDKMKKALVFLTWGMETLNKKYDPVDIYLDGWSASIDEDIDSYEEVLEKIYDLYYDHLEMHPMAELALMLATSAAMHHASRSGKAMKIFQGPQGPIQGPIQGPSGDLAEEILQQDLKKLNLS